LLKQTAKPAYGSKRENVLLEQIGAAIIAKAV
jgi:hypothetical protein